MKNSLSTLRATLSTGVLLALVAGCSFVLTPQRLANMTPEQLAAYKDLSLSTFYCFTLAGPPPTGAMTLLLAPHDRSTAVTYDRSCGIIAMRSDPTPAPSPTPPVPVPGPLREP